MALALVLGLALLALLPLLRSIALAVDQVAALLSRLAPRPPAQLSPAQRSSMPDSLREWIEQESEDWAREQLYQEAAEMAQAEPSWQKVEMSLRLQHSRPDQERHD